MRLVFEGGLYAKINGNYNQIRKVALFTEILMTCDIADNSCDASLRKQPTEAFGIFFVSCEEDSD